MCVTGLLAPPPPPLARSVVAAVLVLSVAACGGGSAGSGDSSGGVPRPAITPTAAARFLEQATFGPTAASVAHVQQIGFSAFLDEQFAAPASDYDDPKATDMDLSPLQRRFFANAVAGPDQLRQRMAFGLGQIFVISGRKIEDTHAFVPYERMLLADAFGNYSKLLLDVTLSPAMGRYLDMVDNDKPDPAAGINPNENYAREIMQLFSIGTVKLNPDGTPQRDSAGKPIPTYTQNTVEGFAHVFTGWTFPTQAGATKQTHNPEYYNGPMEVDESDHDAAPKTLLDGLTLPAGQAAAKDLADALGNIFKHPNVGPFISVRLIRQLVTSNPSPAYVQRVTAVFNDNGSGVRGDLRAVAKAILLDPEARRGDASAQVQVQASDGKLKEPVLLVAGLLRALNAKTDGVDLGGYTAGMRQDLFYPPSVFNYYPPDYALKNFNLVGPEFKLYNTTTIVARANFANAVAFGGLPAGTTVDLKEWTSLAANPAALVDALDERLTRSAMSPAAKQALLAALNVTPADNLLYRAQSTLYLVAISSQYAIQR